MQYALNSAKLIIIDREAREIMYLIASVRLSVPPLTSKVFVCVSVIDHEGFTDDD